jgi:hypothetical protein
MDKICQMISEGKLTNKQSKKKQSKKTQSNSKETRDLPSCSAKLNGKSTSDEEKDDAEEDMDSDATMKTSNEETQKT